MFYAFDPRRTAILLIGGANRQTIGFYKRLIPIADRLYDEHLEMLKKERAIR
ncbi:MAG: type II toxin-antitoxin system RelE/ParE family toxin [Geminicoccales bacterium]